MHTQLFGWPIRCRGGLNFLPPPFGRIIEVINGDLMANSVGAIKIRETTGVGQTLDLCWLCIFVQGKERGERKDFNFRLGDRQRGEYSFPRFFPEADFAYERGTIIIIISSYSSPSATQSKYKRCKKSWDSLCRPGLAQFSVA